MITERATGPPESLVGQSRIYVELSRQPPNNSGCFLVSECAVVAVGTVGGDSRLLLRIIVVEPARRRYTLAT